MDTVVHAEGGRDGGPLCGYKGKVAPLPPDPVINCPRCIVLNRPLTLKEVHAVFASPEMDELVRNFGRMMPTERTLFGKRK